MLGQELEAFSGGPPDDYAAELAEAVAARVHELDGRIDELSPEWPASRLGAVERNVLRIALCELDRGAMRRDVVIDALALAQKYASEDARRLVGGILRSVTPSRR